MRKMNKKIAAVAVGAVALTGTGVAYAFWTTGGSGTGSATVGTDSPVTVVASPDANEVPLVPGGAVNSLKLVVTNPNSYDVSLAGREVTITPGSVKCDDVVVPDAWFTLAQGKATITNPKLAAAAGTAPTATTITASGLQLQMNNDTRLTDGPDADTIADGNQDVCKSATVAFELTIADPTA